jgi:hypothetical protein
MNRLGTIVASTDGALDRFLAKSGAPGGAGRYELAGFGGGGAVRPADADFEFAPDGLVFRTSFMIPGGGPMTTD